MGISPLALQTKLEMGAEHHPLEREADQVAARVMRMTDPTVAADRPVNAGEQDGGVLRQTSGAAVPEVGAPPIVHDVLASPGQPLDADTRAFMEPRFGATFNGIRIHADDRAEAAARRIHARAFTVGTDIAFASGHYAPHTTEGRHLLAHELAHVVQQSRGDRAVLRQQPDGLRDTRATVPESPTDRFAEVLTRSKQYVGPDAAAMVESLLSPTNLAIMSGTLVAWAGSHIVGVGEAVDAGLLVVGAFTLGSSAGTVLTSLLDFARLTLSASTTQDLDRAAQAFAHAVVAGGVTAVMGLLLRSAVKANPNLGSPSVADAFRSGDATLPRVGTDPAAGKMWSQPSITRTTALGAGAGRTTPFGDMQISTLGSATDQALALAHELVHRFFTPRLGILRTFRVQVRMAGYSRTALLRYVEESLAETFAQLRVNGLNGLITGLKFPVANGYVTLGALATEGVALGTVTAGGQVFYVTFVENSAPPGRD